MDIRKNDIVQVIAGRSRGPSGQPTRGRVLEVEPRKQRIYVEHVNMVKRHVRPNPAKQIRGGILEKEGPIHVSNVRWFAAIAGPHASSTGKWRKARKYAFAPSAKNRWISKGREERKQTWLRD